MFLTQQSLYDKRASATKTKTNISHAPQRSDSSFDYTESSVKTGFEGSCFHNTTTLFAITEVETFHGVKHQIQNNNKLLSLKTKQQTTYFIIMNI